MPICEKCRDFGLLFDRKYSPDQFFEGKRSSKIWIIGLNPRGPLGHNDTRSLNELEDYFNSNYSVHSYFHDFKTVSFKLYSMLGENNGAGHTDLVKCFSESFPPSAARKDAMKIVSNCKNFLKSQINYHAPRILICNGTPVCKYIREIIIPLEQLDQRDTCYWGMLDGKRIAVVFSGFIGRIDNFAKVRLGQEIDLLLQDVGAD